MNPSLDPRPLAMLPAPDLIRRYTSLDVPQRLHLESLMASWSLLADLSFSDLLLFAPVTRDSGEGDEAVPGFEAAGLGLTGLGVAGFETSGMDVPGYSDPSGLAAPPNAFVVLGQIRPTTSQTLYESDLVGQVQPVQTLLNMVEAYQTGVIIRAEQPSAFADGLVRITHIPVRHRGTVLGVLCRIWSPWTTRRRGTLERVYLELFERLSVMVADGLFPFADDEAAVEEAPRVGDGVLVIDAHERITYASPNAVNALHRASITSAMVGSSLATLGLETSAINEAFANKLPAIEEVERLPDVILTVRCIPLISRGEVTGAAILLRDVTDLRRRDRLLLTKDATIREVHHRVKNNLQTISSLLRLQARRLDDTEVAGRTALLEAERRIRAIALVHDILARDSTEQVPFEEIVSALVNMVRETNTISFPVTIEVDGGLGDVAAAVATPLAVAIAELLQNAMEHAFPEAWCAGRWKGADACVELVLREQPEVFEIVVRDNGRGLPEGFDIDKTRSLGLSIVRDLVRSQLGGTITMDSDEGTVVRLNIPANGRPGWGE
jgi:two-component sensor histidine kinase